MNRLPFLQADWWTPARRVVAVTVLDAVLAVAIRYGKHKLRPVRYAAHGATIISNLVKVIR